MLDIGTIVKARRVNYLYYLATQNKTEMLYKFFETQWKHSVAGDWTVQVRLDLAEFGIPEELEVIRSQSKYTFKKLVKIKAKESAFYKFMEMKEKHSKMRDLWYADLGMQEYLKLETMSACEAKTVFSYRTRSAQYSDNYRGSPSGLSPCPLCLLHLDCQALAFQCSVIKENVEITEKYQHIFNSSVNNNLARILVKIENVREDFVNQKSLS